jgi:cellulose synthase/poly-beta-1,6-N-acetylglucosamine synthase-like glycosyltransferase
MEHSVFLRALCIVNALVLVAFNLRRLLFTLVALARRPVRTQPPTARNLPRVLALVPCRDEAAALPGLIECLDRLDYPADRWRVALIDDGSADDTRRVIERAAVRRPAWHAISFDANCGKACAMNDALARIDFGDVVVVYDADHRPESGSLRRLVAAFDDPTVAGASGRTRVHNAFDSWPATYTAIESTVHQLITMRAKDRLNLAPALLGSNCAYRRSVLAAVGGFRTGALLEDSDLTVTLARHGYRLRYVPDAVAWQQAPPSVDGYVRQHVRWGRGFHAVARDQIRATLLDARLPLRLRIELAMFSLGYLDRLALLAAIGLSGLRVACQPGRRGWLRRVLAFSLLMPLLQIVVALRLDRAPRGMWLRLPVVPLLFGLDVLVAARAMIDSILDRPRSWAKTERVNG